MRASKAIASLVLAASVAAGCASPTSGLFRRVRPPVAFELLRDNPSVPILDMRTLAGYAGPRGHLAGALCYPLDELNQREAELRHLRERTLLIYCDTDECSEAGLAWFLAHDFKNAMLMHGGIEGWIDSGFGTVLSENPSAEDSGPESDDDDQNDEGFLPLAERGPIGKNYPEWTQRSNFS